MSDKGNSSDSWEKIDYDAEKSSNGMQGSCALTGTSSEQAKQCTSGAASRDVAGMEDTLAHSTDKEKHAATESKTTPSGKKLKPSRRRRQQEKSKDSGKENIEAVELKSIAAETLLPKNEEQTNEMGKMVNKTGDIPHINNSAENQPENGEERKAAVTISKEITVPKDGRKVCEQTENDTYATLSQVKESTVTVEYKENKENCLDTASSDSDIVVLGKGASVMNNLDKDSHRPTILSTGSQEVIAGSDKVELLECTSDVEEIYQSVSNESVERDDARDTESEDSRSIGKENYETLYPYVGNTEKRKFLLFFGVFLIASIAASVFINYYIEDVKGEYEHKVDDLHQHIAKLQKQISEAKAHNVKLEHQLKETKTKINSRKEKGNCKGQNEMKGVLKKIEYFVREELAESLSVKMKHEQEYEMLTEMNNNAAKIIEKKKLADLKKKRDIVAAEERTKEEKDAKSLKQWYENLEIKLNQMDTKSAEMRREKENAQAKIAMEYELKKYKALPCRKKCPQIMEESQNAAHLQQKIVDMIEKQEKYEETLMKNRHSVQLNLLTQWNDCLTKIINKIHSKRKDME